MPAAVNVLLRKATHGGDSLDAVHHGSVTVHRGGAERAGFLWRAGLPRVGLRSGPKTWRRGFSGTARRLDWERFALQRGASPLATRSPLATGSSLTMRRPLTTASRFAATHQGFLARLWLFFCAGLGWWDVCVREPGVMKVSLLVVLLGCLVAGTASASNDRRECKEEQIGRASCRERV